ncbi:hypothetical protein [Hymenobacter sp.]|uniref:hypothetical protein n=1 Tax=Hymenobacter sp. TaxID=1898978 RepID=UPI002EDA8871
MQVLAEDGVDSSHHTSNHVNEYAAVPFDYVLTVCDHAKSARCFQEAAPQLSGSGQGYGQRGSGIE